MLQSLPYSAVAHLTILKRNNRIVLSLVERTSVNERTKEPLHLEVRDLFILRYRFDKVQQISKMFYVARGHKMTRLILSSMWRNLLTSNIFVLGWISNAYALIADCIKFIKIDSYLLQTTRVIDPFQLLTSGSKMITSVPKPCKDHCKNRSIIRKISLRHTWS